MCLSRFVKMCRNGREFEMKLKMIKYNTFRSKDWSQDFLVNTVQTLVSSLVKLEKDWLNACGV